MKSSEFVIRPATQEDVEAWYGVGQRKSLRAIVGVLDGEVIAIGGVYRDKEFMVGIAGLRKHMRHRKREAVLMAREGRKILQKYPFVVAFADKNEPTADGLIKHFGFEYLRDTEFGRMYLWMSKPKAPSVE